MIFRRTSCTIVKLYRCQIMQLSKVKTIFFLPLFVYSGEKYYFCSRFLSESSFDINRQRASVGGLIAQLVSSTWLIIRGSLVQAQVRPQEYQSFTIVMTDILFCMPHVVIHYQVRFFAAILMNGYSYRSRCSDAGLIAAESPTNHLLITH